jgi:hypothetical protein
MPFGQEGLVVTWTVPVPKMAKVTVVNADIFTEAAKLSGPEIPEDMPGKYTEKLQKAELFNSTVTWNNEDLVRWEKRYGIEMEKDPLAAFERYLSTDHAVFGTLVSHPKVADAARWKACSVVLQRGVIILDPPAAKREGETEPEEVRGKGRERLFLRSYFHSAKDGDNYVNFAPPGGIEIAFASDAIWYPLELSQFIEEPVSYVVLDILTRTPLEEGQLPKLFKLEKSAKMTHAGQDYSLSRVTAKLEAKKKVADLNLKVAGTKDN